MADGYAQAAGKPARPGVITHPLISDLWRRRRLPAANCKWAAKVTARDPYLGQINWWQISEKARVCFKCFALVYGRRCDWCVC